MSAEGHRAHGVQCDGCLMLKIVGERDAALARLGTVFDEGVAAERTNHKRIEAHNHWSSISSTAPPPSPPNPYRAALTEGSGK